MRAHRLVRAERRPLLQQARLAMVLSARRDEHEAGRRHRRRRLRRPRARRAFPRQPAARFARSCDRAMPPRRCRRASSRSRDLATASEARARRARRRRGGGRASRGARARDARNGDRSGVCVSRGQRRSRPTRLAQAAVRAGVARFVFASTVKVNGESTQPGRPFRPDDPPAPHDAYARSKLEAERELAASCRRHDARRR